MTPPQRLPMGEIQKRNLLLLPSVCLQVSRLDISLPLTVFAKLSPPQSISNTKLTVNFKVNFKF